MTFKLCVIKTGLTTKVVKC